MKKMNRPYKNKKNKGFTLLEVLVALAVFAVAAIALMRVSESQLQLSARLEDKTFAHWVALNMVSEMQANQDWPDLGEQTGKVAMAGRDWKIIVKTLATPMSRVRRIEVTVGLAPQDFTQNMEAITVLSGFIELPSVQTTSNES
ncbi:type II secretion system protein GspI [Moraxellaceae bacterium AER2_44_116]|nr:type II secretion system minor pseudopilin GspI [Moraxellaceae bacterium]TQC99871.1 type II secretion system protein GspI [Moraxellaceae bacterium AER2_44_116]